MLAESDLSEVAHVGPHPPADTCCYTDAYEDDEEDADSGDAVLLLELLALAWAGVFDALVEQLSSFAS